MKRLYMIVIIICLVFSGCSSAAEISNKDNEEPSIEIDISNNMVIEEQPDGDAQRVDFGVMTNVWDDYTQQYYTLSVSAYPVDFSQPNELLIKLIVGEGNIFPAQGEIIFFAIADSHLISCEIEGIEDTTHKLSYYEGENTYVLKISTPDSLSTESGCMNFYMYFSDTVTPGSYDEYTKNAPFRITYCHSSEYTSNLSSEDNSLPSFQEGKELVSEYSDAKAFVSNETGYMLDSSIWELEREQIQNLVAVNFPQGRYVAFVLIDDMLVSPFNGESYAFFETTNDLQMIVVNCDFSEEIESANSIRTMVLNYETGDIVYSTNQYFKE